MERAIGSLRAIIGVVVALVVVIGGAGALGVLGAPSVSDVKNRFAGVDDTTTTIETTVSVNNPNPFGVQLGGVTVNYTVDLNEVRLAKGTHEGVNVTSGNSTLTFRTAMDNEQIPKWWAAHIRDGERSHLVVHATVRSSTLGRAISLDPVDREIATDLLSSFNSTETRPVNANQPAMSDPVLYINETGAEWGQVTNAETPIRMAFVIHNPKTVPYTVTGIGYQITMNDVAVGSGETDRAYLIPGKSTRTVRATTVIDNSALDDWWVSHLERNQVTDLRIEFYAIVDFPSGQTVKIPLDALTYTETMETDIFGNKDETAGNRGSTATPGGSGSPTPSGGARTATDGSRTATPEPTTTQTETPTDDGGLLG